MFLKRSGGFSDGEQMRIDAPVTAAAGKQSPPLYRGAFCFRAGGTGDGRKENNHWQDDASTTASCFGMSLASRTLLSSEYFGLEKKKEYVSVQSDRGFLPIWQSTEMGPVKSDKQKISPLPPSLAHRSN